MFQYQVNLMDADDLVIVLASHPCTLSFARVIELIAHPKITQILSFSWGFSLKVAFAHPKMSFAHPELPFLAKYVDLVQLQPTPFYASKSWQLFNSLVPEDCKCNLKSVIIKHN